MNDTLPISLTQFGDELQRAITRELQTPEPTPPPRRRLRRRRILVAGVAGCAVAGAAAAAVVLTGGGSSSSVSDAQVLRAAAIALPKPAPNTIVHVSVTQTMAPAARHGTVNTAAPTVNAEGWFQQGAPYRSVTRETLPGSTADLAVRYRVLRPATKRCMSCRRCPEDTPTTR